MDRNLQVFTTKDAARVLRRAPSTLKKWRVTGRGPKFHKLNRGVVYTFEELDRFVSANLFGCTAEYKP